ncbi:hypothetical protein ACB092_01G261100, partial [Castanea dentata]
MKILSLNCSGLGIPKAVQELRCLIHEEDPKLLFLSETKLDRDGFRRLKRKLDFQQGFDVPRVGLGGGLALLWRDNVEIDVQTSSPHHIDALINVSHSLPWLLIGDFNEILHSDEYWGSGSRPFHQIAEFTRIVDDCSLIDLGAS